MMYNFSREQIVNDEDYLFLCEYFFQLAATDIIRKKLENILYDGVYDNFTLKTGMSNIDNIIIEKQRRISIANLLVKNPKAFDYLVANKINIFHGTSANNLESIMTTGLNSYLEAKKNGITILSNDLLKQQDLCDCLSFTDNLDIAERYAALNSTIKDDRLSFPVIIGTNKEELRKRETCKVESNTPTIGIRKKLPIESIKIILVPFDKVKMVKKIVGENIKVYGIDYYYDKFYSLTDNGKITFLDDKFELYQKNLKSSINFDFNEYETILFQKPIIGIKKQIEKVKILVRSVENNYGEERFK